MKRHFLVVVALGLAALGAGAQTQAPAAKAAPAGDAQGQSRALFDLLNQIEALGRQLRELRGELEEMSNKVEVLNDRVQKSEKRQSDLYNDTDTRVRRIEQLAKDDGEARKKLTTQAGEIDARLRKLEGTTGVAANASQVSDLDVRLKKLESSTGTSASLVQLGEVDLRLKKLETAAAASAAIPAPVMPAAVVPPGAATTPVVAAPAAPAPPTPPVPPVGVGAGTAAAPDAEMVRRAYEAALAKQRAGDSAGAVTDFRNFLKLYPRHELAPNAQYWLGEAYFRMADYPSAIAAQQKLLVTYPDHLKAPDAMLILANAQNSNGDPGGARRTLEDLIAKHPQSEAAEKAKQRLARLK
jgi:tol-pal system protein YbgF